MKFLLLIFFACLCLAASADFSPHSFYSDVQFYDDGKDEHFHEEIVGADEDVKEDLKKKLKERFDEILEKLKDTLENGKGFREDTIKKLKEIREKLKDLKVDLGDKAKELIEKLKDKAKDYWQKILDRLELKESVSFADNDEEKSLRERLTELLEEMKNYRDKDQKIPRDILLEVKKIFDTMEQKNIQLTVVDKLIKWAVEYHLKNPHSTVLAALSAEEDDDLARNLRERFEEILEKIKEAIENRKVLGGNVVAKMREIYNQMKEKSIPFGDKVKELLEQMKEKATGLWKRILDKINISETSIPARGTGAENLRERLQELLENLKESFRDRKLPGRGFFTKLRKVRLEMRQKNVPMGGKLRNMIETMKENTSGVWRRILDRFGRRGSDSSDELEILYGTGAENLRERLQELLEKLKESFRDRKLPGKGFISKLRQIRDEMRQKNVPLGGKLRDMIEKMKENTSGVWRRILDRFGNRGPESSDELAILYEDPTAEIGKILNKHLDDILDRLKDIIENGKAYKEDLVEKAKEIAQKLKDMKVDIGDHAKNVLKDLKEKAKDYWNKILDKLSFKSESNLHVYMEEPNSELAKALKKHFEEILEKMNDIIENGKTYKDDLIEKAKEIAQKLKDMKVDIGDHARKVLNDLKEKAKDYWNKILDKLSFN